MNALMAGRPDSFAGMEPLYLQAWALLPEPKGSYSWAQTICNGIIALYLQHRHPEKALVWTEKLAQAHGSSDDPHIRMLKGMVFHDNLLFEQAWAEFDMLYKQYKKRPFQGYDEKYLKFYIDRAGLNS